MYKKYVIFIFIFFLINLVGNCADELYKIEFKIKNTSIERILYYRLINDYETILKIINKNTTYELLLPKITFLANIVIDNENNLLPVIISSYKKDDIRCELDKLGIIMEYQDSVKNQIIISRNLIGRKKIRINDTIKLIVLDKFNSISMNEFSISGFIESNNYYYPNYIIIIEEVAMTILKVKKQYTEIIMYIKANEFKIEDINQIISEVRKETKQELSYTINIINK